MKKNYDLLEKMSSQLSSLDEELLILLKRRLQTIKKATEYALKEGEKFSAEAEEERLLREKSAKASTMSLPANFVQDIFERIAQESLKEEERIKREHKNKQ